LDFFYLHFGYLMIFVVAAIEGEGAVVAGAVLAQRGQLSFPGAVLASFLGTFLIAEGMFHLAKWKGRAWVVEKAGGSPRLRRIERWLAKRGGPLLLFGRFLWGMRIWIPAVCAVGGMRPKKFLFWNLAGAIVWISIVAPVSYYFGEGLQALDPQMQNGALGVVVVLTLFVVFSVLRHAHKTANSDDAD
jgi:membrane protein DedA with SNARE-associated domain